MQDFQRQNLDNLFSPKYSNIRVDIMQFIFDGKAYKAVKISGPNNLLSLVFDTNGNKEIKVLALKGNTSANIDKWGIKNQVSSGLEEANKEFGINYKIKEIQLVPFDTPVMSIKN